MDDREAEETRDKRRKVKIGEQCNTFTPSGGLWMTVVWVSWGWEGGVGGQRKGWEELWRGEMQRKVKGMLVI